MTGLGDATLNGRELAVASYLRDHVVPLLIGKDPARIEDMWQYLYRGAYWRRGPVTMTAIAAVDTALWDIKGKVAGLPVYQLLGGRVAGRRAWSTPTPAARTSPSLLDDVARFLDLGYRAIRAQAAVPGHRRHLRGAQGHDLRAGRHLAARRAAVVDRGLPGLRARPICEAVRDRFGFDFHLLHDVHHRLTPIEAARFGKAVEDCRLFWMEDPTPAENQEAFRLIRQHTTTPIAIGEVLNSIWDVQHLITEQLIDYVRTTVVHAGGITHLRRIFDLAALYQVRTGSHGATDLSPITLAAAVHLDLAVPNFGIQEYMAARRRDHGGLPHATSTSRTACSTPPRCPAWASSTTRRPPSASRTSPRYLPVARRLDGSVHDW